MPQKITREILFNYFDHQSTSSEKIEIERWVNDPMNSELFYEYLAQWENQNRFYASDVDTAWARHQDRINAHRKSSRATKTVSFKKFMAAASVVIGLIVVGVFSKDRIFYRSIQTAYGQIKSIKLDDGTEVVLNSNSMLTVPRFGFGSSSRNVLLNGEARFSVTHLATNQKFIVNTVNHSSVVVLGTEFTVSTRQMGTQVVLSKGKIQLNYKENKSFKNLIMTPGKLVSIDSVGKKKEKKVAHPEVFSAWKDHLYVFDKTPLREICALFKNDFGMTIEIIDPVVSDWTVSGSFKAMDAAQLLTALVESSGLTYQVKDGTITIYPLSKK